MKFYRSFSNSFPSIINIYTVNSALTVYVFVILGSHIFFNRGLEEDGALNFSKLLLSDGVLYYEAQREFFNMFHKLPVWLFIHFSPVQSLSVLTKIYSFSHTYIHVIALTGCFLLLPQKRKQLIFFPLLAFFAGPAIALGISVSIAISVCGYIWLTAFLIHYSDLSKRIHKALFCLIPLPLLLSHELMSYMAWPLIGLLYLKDKKESAFWNKFLIRLFIVFFIMISALSVFFTLNIDAGQLKYNFLQFRTTLLHFKFLFSESAFSLPVTASLLLNLSLLAEIFFTKRKKSTQIICLFVLIMSCLAVVFMPFPVYKQLFLTKDYYLRVWPPVYSLPFCLLLWWFCEIKKVTLKNATLFLFSCCTACTAFTVYRVKSDFYFYKHRKAFSRQLQKCEGIVEWSSVKERFRDVKSYRKIEEQLWKISAMSLIFPQERNIKTIIVNDYCIKNCLNKGIDRKECESQCRSLRFNIPENLPELSLSRFFNFNPLSENVSKGLSVCKNQRP